jgi:hypothetical protein
MSGIGIVRGRGELKPAAQRQAIVRTRPITTPEPIGLRGSAQHQAAIVYECVRLICAGHDVSEVSALTNLDAEFIETLAEMLDDTPLPPMNSGETD